MQEFMPDSIGARYTYMFRTFVGKPMQAIAQ
jgi:hypothetical protein